MDRQGNEGEGREGTGGGREGPRGDDRVELEGREAGEGVVSG